MAGDVQDFRTAIGVLDDGLDDQANFGKLAVLGADVAGETGRPGVNADAGDEPSVDGARFGGKANLGVRAGDFGLRAVDDGEELLENRVRPDRIALGGILGIWRGYVANGDEVSEICGPSWRGKEPGDIIGGERGIRLDRCDGSGVPELELLPEGFLCHAALTRRTPRIASVR